MGLRAYQRVYVQVSGLTCDLSGAHSGYWAHVRAHAPRQTPNPPKCRPIHLKQPVFSVFRPMDLQFRSRTASSCGLVVTDRGELRHTGVRHAGDTPTQRFEWRKTPTTTGVERTRGPGRPAPSARGLWQGSARLRADTPSHPARPSHRISGTKLSPLTRPRRISGTKLSPLTRNGPIWRNPRMQGEFCTVFTTMKPSRENFVPNTRQKSS